jgi:3',5'-cyclic AMP phosphodiesterase CpdA
MRAVDDPEAAIIQARWLDDVLDREKARWVIVSHHHPIFSVALGRDNPSLREHWLPIYERRGVDLVLQGHDHAYGRGRNLVEGRTVAQGEGGPVFVVSVAGPKQYIAAESKTVAGRVYDAFDIVYLPNGEKRVVSDLSSHTSQTRCGNLKRPAQNRCWEGNEFVN